jgi:hypothetical protein
MKIIRSWRKYKLPKIGDQNLLDKELPKAHKQRFSMHYSLLPVKLKIQIKTQL